MTTSLLGQKSNRFVAHFDMLGMSTLALRDSDLAFSALSRLCDAKEKRLSMEFELIQHKRIVRDRIDHFSFSDSVIILTHADTEDDAYAIGILCTEFFYSAFSSGVPLRGGIAHGEILHDSRRDLLAGPALVNAVCIGEEAQWLGIVLDSATGEIFQRLSMESDRGRHICMKYPVPLKEGSRPGWIVDWVEPHHASFNLFPWSVEKLYSIFLDFGGPYKDLPHSVWMKYQNTVDFINQPRK